jgi:uncharacterized protein
MIGDYISGALSELGNYAETAFNETTVRIAVTGFSRAGKTVFLTSLIHNLLALGQQRDTLPALRRHFETGGPSRLRSIRLCGAGASAIPHFDYDAKLAELASGTPAWPRHTDDLAEITLEMEVERVNPVWQRLGGRRRVRLELLDYPGEWLLDLPLLSQTYKEWSEQTLRMLRQSPRQSVCMPFLDFLTSVQPDGPADDIQIQRGVFLYRTALEECRHLGLRYLQPGRFLCPGPRGDVPLLWFFPIAGVTGYATHSSLVGVLGERFEAYKADIRAQFFDTHFAAFDRQIFLVDVLSALHAGKEVFKDIERAIADVAAHLRYGPNWLPRAVAGIAGGAAKIVGSGLALAGHSLGAAATQAASGAIEARNIERVAFVATKADHVPSLRRENLKNLLRNLVEAARANELPGRPVSYHTVASVLSTVDGTAKIDGRPVEVVLGRPLGEELQRAFHPGDVPSGRPPESFWSDRFFELPVFAPPRIDPSGSTGIPHLGLDEVLSALLEDVL